MTNEKVSELIAQIEDFRLNLCRAATHGEECEKCDCKGVCDAAISVWAKLIRIRPQALSGSDEVRNNRE